MKKGTKNIKAQKKSEKERLKQEKRNKKKIKQLKKRKQEEQIAIQKELKRQQKRERDLQKKRIKRKLNSKELKRMRRVKKIMRTVLITLIFLILFLLLILSPIFNISDVQVQGNNIISKDEIISLLGLNKETNIFRESKNDIKEKLKENSYINIEKTEIKRKLPSTLKITIKERETEYLLEFGSSYAYIDKSGYILEISAQSIEGKIKVRGYTTSEENIKPGNRLCQEDLEKLGELNQIIAVTKNYEIYDKITSANIESKEDYTLYMEEEQKTVHLGEVTSLDTKMLYVKKILEREKDYDGEIFVNVDLNTRNPYFKQNI